MKINTITLRPIFAQQIVDKISQAIGYNVNLFDTNGRIVGSTEKNRIHEYHEGAYKAISTCKEVIINDNNKSSYVGSKSGINLPLEWNKKLIGVIGISGPPEEIKRYALITKVTAETMINNTFAKLQNRTEITMKEHLIHNIIYHSEENNYPIKQQASLLGIDLSSPKVAILVDLETFETYKESKKYIDQVLQCIDFVFAGKNDYLQAYIGDSKFIVFVPINKVTSLDVNRMYFTRIANHINDILAQTFDCKITIGIGSLCQSKCSLKNSFEEALEAITIGLDQSINNVFFADDLGLDLLLKNIPQKTINNFFHNMVGNNPIYKIFDDTLVNTLEEFFNHNLNISETARALFIHRNTLLYRLEKVFKLTNKDPRSFLEAIELKVLLSLGKVNEREKPLKEVTME
ncbi:CdaR family transcriptional regulator [Anaerobacillus isosaccharinicus]|uniref:Helix-turn-helix domain-containing protein n=1 Tax=Anaerobacillus isosaccharinicus TaxID=1532552 RepID=A0A1S2MFD0_9BACI|nr:sugar diacid recognition domain-containing protein [Anaerobacillus isosaccharinicus]MBA5588298.1 helix-turn-helix domain-containing protein [Anaerobacillus isosaccharinicus]QOY38265.1 helix-turn-helix domain-containing protein [Anaerobacillus isosaccharinicus]